MSHVSAEQQNVPHPALHHPIQIQDAHWRISQLTQRGELVRTAGGGEQMEIHQRSAHFTPSALHGKGRTHDFMAAKLQKGST